MSIVEPKGHNHLCADARFRLRHKSFAHIAVDGVDKVGMPLSDALMSACAMFSLQAPSLLALDKQRAEGHWHTMYGLARVA